MWILWKVVFVCNMQPAFSTNYLLLDKRAMYMYQKKMHTIDWPLYVSIKTLGHLMFTRCKIIENLTM